MEEIKRGDIFYARLGDKGKYEKKHVHIQGGQRPVLVVQNDVGNHFSPVIIIIPITTAHKPKTIPTHYTYYHTKSHGTILCEQIMTISRNNLINKIDKLTKSEMSNVDKKIKISIGLE